MMKTVGEFDLIQSLSKKIQTSSRVIHGVGDDTAVIKQSLTHYSLFTTDMMVEGVHFTQRMPARYIGHKALAVNISDIASMGGLPQSAVISLGVPKGFDIAFLKQCYDGITALAKKYQVDIVGGDTVTAPQLMINIALTGEVKKKQLTIRSGAKEGDYIFVTGPLGRSLDSEHHMRFKPRVEEAQYLVRYQKPSAMIDLSDGLASDIKHILNASKVGALLDEKSVPRRQEASFKEALCDGEDFELLFTVSPKKAQALINNKKYDFHHIGHVVARRNGFKYIDTQGRHRLCVFKGYEHLT